LDFINKVGYNWILYTKKGGLQGKKDIATHLYYYIDNQIK